MASDPTLRRWYLKFNDQWFGAALPYDLEVFWEPARGALGDTCELRGAYIDGRDTGKPEMLIRIDPTLRFSSAMAQMTLLHEMVHVKLHPHMAHGKRFNAEMLKLATFGAFNGRW
jgi:hypothetical protein